MRQLRVNERIRISQVRVIGEQGEQLGVMAPPDAIRLARERGLDLVEVAPQTNPPVCRILDFNKFRYEEQRREREAKKKHHIAKLKELKFKPRIEEHDYQVKLRKLKNFLMQGDQAKVTMVYRGREMAHIELGRRILDRLVEDLKIVSKVERTPQLDGRFMTMVFGPDREKIQRLERQAAAKQKALAQGSGGGRNASARAAAAVPATPTADAASAPSAGSSAAAESTSQSASVPNASGPTKAES